VEATALVEATANAGLFILFYLLTPLNFFLIFLMKRKLIKPYVRLLEKNKIMISFKKTN
jgi:hypothetical protein